MLSEESLRIILNLEECFAGMACSGSQLDEKFTGRTDSGQVLIGFRQIFQIYTLFAPITFKPVPAELFHTFPLQSWARPLLKWTVETLHLFVQCPMQLQTFPGT